ncbi:MAG TPA: hypothetical protein VMT28_09615, partial [Terriglobales bacterium]|nr:hypothetical protein [Terriglobales bacterium]
MATAQSLGLPRTVISTNYANLAPRFGFAWRPFGGLKTVVRGGYGIFYNSSIQNPIRTQMGDQFPYAIAETYSKNASKPTFLTLETPCPTGTKHVLAGQNNVSGYTSVQPPTGYLQSWNLTVE